MATVTAYLQFDGNCREAMNFYREALGGELYMDTFGGSPMAGDMPKEAQDRILHAALVHGSTALLYASDIMKSGTIPRGEDVVLTLNCNSQEEIEGCFARLSEGGKVVEPLADAFWGSVFGMLQDKYGFQWMLNFDKNPRS